MPAVNVLTDQQVYELLEKRYIQDYKISVLSLEYGMHDGTISKLTRGDRRGDVYERFSADHSDLQLPSLDRPARCLTTDDIPSIVDLVVHRIYEEEGEST